MFDFGALAGAGIGALGDLVANERNIGMQRETNAQMLALQREAWTREDTSVQRRVADLQAAGLSPVLAAGQGASSSGPIRLESPHGDTAIASNAVQAATALMRMKSDIATAKSQRSLIDAQALKTRSEADFLARTFEGRAEEQSYRVEQARADAWYAFERLDLTRDERLRIAEWRDTLKQRFSTSPGAVDALIQLATLREHEVTASDRERNLALYREFGLPSNFGWDVLTRSGFMLKQIVDQVNARLKAKAADLDAR